MVFSFHFPSSFHLSPSCSFLLLFPFLLSFLTPFSISLPCLSAIIFTHRDTGCSRMWKIIWYSEKCSSSSSCSMLQSLERAGNSCSEIILMEPWYPSLLSLFMVSYVNMKKTKTEVMQGPLWVPAPCTEDFKALPQGHYLPRSAKRRNKRSGKPCGNMFVRIPQD